MSSCKYIESIKLQCYNATWNGRMHANCYVMFSCVYAPVECCENYGVYKLLATNVTVIIKYKF